MKGWGKLTDSRIRKAEAEGQFSDLAGSGKPLPDRSGLAHVDAGTAIGHRIMAEAGALPREIELKKRMLELQAALAAETDAVRRKALMAEFAKVQMRHAMESEARRAFLRR